MGASNPCMLVLTMTMPCLPACLLACEPACLPACPLACLPARPPTCLPACLQRSERAVGGMGPSYNCVEQRERVWTRGHTKGLQNHPYAVRVWSSRSKG
eukprot:350112-Chlamydomonas_euryale.AAC.2